MMYRLLTWLNKPQPLFLFAALLVFLYAGTSHADVRDELAAIQKEAHYFYLPDQKASECFQGQPCGVSDVFKVLPKNSPASCSHWAAKKVQLIRERQMIAFPVIAVFDKTVNGLVYSHAVVIVPKAGTSGYWLLDNDTWRLKEVDNLDWMVNAQFGTLEQFQEAYDVATD